MTIREWLIRELVSCGFFETQAEEIVAKHIRECTDASKNERWEDQEDNYLQILLRLLFQGLFVDALEYIDKNCPEAWFRPVFDPEHPANVTIKELQSHGH